MTAAKKKGVRKASDKLSKQEEAFAENYVVLLNGSEAYRKAYPDRAKGVADQLIAERASKLVKKDKIRTRIIKLRETVAERAARRFEITADAVLQRLAAIAYSSIEDVLVIDADGNAKIDLKLADKAALRGFSSVKIKRLEKFIDDEDDGAAETEVPEAATEASGRKQKEVFTSVEVRLPDRTAALTKLGQHLQIFKDDTGTSITVNIADRMTRAVDAAKEKRRAAVS